MDSNLPHYPPPLSKKIKKILEDIRGSIFTYSSYYRFELDNFVIFTHFTTYRNHETSIKICLRPIIFHKHSKLYVFV